ncbi:MAG: ORF6N domain-containing protein [Desulfobacterales bacterium]|uniref:ORF6N domain-containing protein n=1 Tax=Candidatus Desulfatibia vada TaxID=2841696 RepID=A0A8J6P8D9_9BACT|nr:ORF6N domain-containing protein [Candidatus Desulfatibia vada]MBL7218154.1 ORF6N domain-containing protein [Desulfobacteraceae bacterium]
MYGVETKRINEAVKNNPDKFPTGYVIELDKTEWDGLKSKFSTSIKGGKVKLPSAFSEKGLYMLATILKSQHAVRVTLAIIETFSKIRELSRNIKTLSNVKTGVPRIRKTPVVQKQHESIKDFDPFSFSDEGIENLLK